MFDVIDRLNLEIINIQILDNYLKDGCIRFDECFMRDDYKEEMQRLEKLVLPYEDDQSFDNNDYIEDDYTLDDVLEELVKELDIYSELYNIPEVSIENRVWEVFFETVGDFYIEHELDGFFMSDMIALNRYAICRAMVYEEKSISLKTYISSLKYIESDILSINNIIDIAERLERKFDIDALSLIANKDGSYGCLNKDFKLFIVNDEIDCLDQEELKQLLEKDGYQIKTSLDVCEDKSYIINSYNENVIDFNLYKTKVKKAKN